MSRLNMDDPRYRFRYEYAKRKRKWRLRRIVHQAFLELDPEGLTRLGAPDDEYDREISEVTNQLDRERGVSGQRKLGLEAAATIVAIVMHTSFDTWTKLPTVGEKDRQLAARILELEAENGEPATEASGNTPILPEE